MRAPLAVVVVVALATGSLARTSGAQAPRTVVVHRALIDSLSRVAPARPLIRVNAAGTMAQPVRTDTVSLRPGELLVKPTGSSPTLDKTAATKHYDLPATIVAPTTAGSVSEFTIAVESPGLAFNPHDNQFAGIVLVGLDDSVHRASVEQLTSPVTVQLSTNDPSVAVQPDLLRLDHTNVPYVTVRVAGTSMRGDTVLLSVRPTFDIAHTFRLAVVRPVLSVDASPQTIAGYGFEKARLTVGVPVAAGRDSFSVTLSGHLSKPAVGSLIVSANHPASTDVLSRGLGVDTIEVEGDPFGTRVAPITYRFPYLFILFAVLGGLAGGAVKFLDSEARKALSIGAAAPWLAAGILTGMIVASGAAVGINLTPLSLPSEFSEGVAFVVAAVGAYVGLSRAGAGG
jgi:hypothetical protein